MGYVTHQYQQHQRLCSVRHIIAGKLVRKFQTQLIRGTESPLLTSNWQLPDWPSPNTSAGRGTAANLELGLAGVEVDPAVVPARPQRVVDTQEHHHVLPDMEMFCVHWRTLYNSALLGVKVHDLHGPEREDVLLVEEDTGLLRVLDPLHGVHEGDGPLVGDGGGVDGAGPGGHSQPGLRTQVWLIRAWTRCFSMIGQWPPNSNSKK